MRDDKYVVFKRKDWESLKEGQFGRQYSAAERFSVPDAVVIRKQDIFAAPGLFSYANAIQSAVEILQANMIDTSKLQEIADYFHEQGIEAQHVEYRKIPD